MNNGAGKEMKMEAVVFDMDGLIFDSERLVLDCWEKVGEKYGIANIREVFTECIGTNKEKTKEIVLAHYGSSFRYDEFRKEASALFQESVREKGLPIKKGARELLQYLKEKEVPVGLASSTRLAVVEEELQQAGLYDYFQVVVGGDLLRRSKPEPDIYLMTCEKMGVAPGNAFAIEDSHNGIRSAYRAGMKPVMVPDMVAPIEEIEEISHAILPSLMEVKEYFEKEKSFA